MCSDAPDRVGGAPVCRIREPLNCDRRSACETFCLLGQSTSLIDRCEVADECQLRGFNYRTSVADTVQGHTTSRSVFILKLPPLIAEPDRFPLENITESDLIVPMARRTVICRSANVCHRLQKKDTNFSLLRTWLDHCRNEHRGRCAASPRHQR